MHRWTLVVLLAGVACGEAAWAQAMTEAAAAAAGGSVGGVAGKKVSDGLTNVLNKVDQQTSKAAQTDAPSKNKAPAAPLLEVGPGVPKNRPKVAAVHPDSVPPPPPVRRAAAGKPAPPPPPPPAVAVAPVPPPPPPPPPPEVTAEDLRTVATGMNRVEVLKLGPPASRITMFDDGHLVEIYRYMTGDTTLGVLRLTDGAVSSIQMR